MKGAFYLETAEGFEATELTRGPWDPGAQHAGPPAALIGRALERLPASPPGSEGEPAPDWRVGRVTFEILRPVPIAPLSVSARIERPGRRVQMVSAELADEGGEVLIRARGWRIAAEEVPIPPEAIAGGEASEVLSPEDSAVEEFFPTGSEVGYHSAMEYRFAAGRFLDPGPAKVWMRMQVPLVAGESPSPLERVLVAADTGNGASATLPWARYLFINVDLTVHLHRLPVGDWVMLDARTTPEPSGLGLSDSALRDRQGPIGRALQTLLVRER